MCGIAGVITSHQNQLDLTSISNQMALKLKHRGPDQQNIEVLNQIGFSHARLSIVDLSEHGNQPMYSNSKRGLITYNGEVYNHKYLKEKYSLKNIKGHCDTEILIELIEKIGLYQALEVIEGMFAFAYYDREFKKVYLARDFFGEKPLYYSLQNGVFFFASELKCFQNIDQLSLKIDQHSLAQYFIYNNVPAPRSIFENVYKVMPGQVLELTLDTTQFNIVKNNFSVNSKTQNTNESPVKNLDNIFTEIIPQYMDVDVPFGSFLSGGIDSSLITAYMQELSSKKIKTFSIGFDNPFYDEAKDAKKIANYLRTDHYEYYFTDKDLLELLPKIHEIYDEPFADASQLPTSLVAQIASKEVRVVLTGDAGDEIFAGYNRHIFFNKVKKVIQSPKVLKSFCSLALDSSAFDLLITNPYFSKIKNPEEKKRKLLGLLQSENISSYYEYLIRYWNMAEKYRFNFPAIDSKDSFEKLMKLDQSFYLPNDVLTKVDRASMAYSLETRAPFLNPKIYHFAKTLDHHELIQGNYGKKILRDLLYKKFPAKFFDRPKSGFAIPLARYLREQLRDWSDHLIKENKDVNPFYEKMQIDKYYQDFLNGDDSLQYLIWTVLVYQMWYENFNCSK